MSNTWKKKHLNDAGVEADNELEDTLITVSPVAMPENMAEIGLNGPVSINNSWEEATTRDAAL
jgi:hypothetical protein